MVNEQELLHSDRYRYRYIDIKILRKDSQDNVLAFGAEYQRTSPPDQLYSNGVIEANQTIWQTDSPKRPSGYIIVESFPTVNGKYACILVERRWFFDEFYHEEYDDIIEQWKQGYINQHTKQETAV